MFFEFSFPWNFETSTQRFRIRRSTFGGIHLGKSQVLKITKKVEKKREGEYFRFRGCHWKKKKKKRRRKKKKRHLGTVGSRSRVVARSWPCLSRQRREPEINKREHGTWTAFSASPRARVAMASIQKYSAGGTLISTWRLRRREKTNRQEVNTFPPHPPPRRVYTRKCMRRASGARFPENLFGEQRLRRQDELVEGVVLPKRELFFDKRNFRLD